jgi:BirA family transcriptional regulator, biotin operon repressor / biotin---[acetyl-CoA-carboxylase] ligase
VSGLEGTSDNVGLMDTRNATSEEENLPGQEFRDRKGRGLADFVSTYAGTHDGPAGCAERWTLRHMEATGSTNDDLLRAGESGAPDRLVLVADHQSAGRGRLDRRWEAPPGANLLVSILFREVPDRPHRLTQAVALAAVSACRNFGIESEDFDVSLKWPNDIVIGQRKLAGILASASTSWRPTGVPDFIVVGLGLNVQWSPADAVCLADFGADVHRDDVLGALVIGLDELLAMDPADLFDVYRSELSTIGRSVRVELPSGDVLRGRALGVGVDGRLEVLDTCAITHHIDVADIVHLRFDENDQS